MKTISFKDRLFAIVVSIITVIALSMMCLPAHATEDLIDSVPAEQIPAALGGKLHGVKIEKETVKGYGTILVTLNYDTGKMLVRRFDGSIYRTNIVDVVNKAAETLKNATPEQQRYVEALSEERISAHDVCPYLVGVIGAAHGLAWGKVLALAAVHPAIAVLEALGESVFWTWVGSHC
ncbi:hypothetical protein ACFQY8_02320 [Alloscardovia venturai]|uniref:Secreted protein n=1 Tax=Alloscardovia venturai TaxID=1769421 RepID=A0ABW2Y3H0_9BIFI